MVRRAWFLCAGVRGPCARWVLALSLIQLSAPVRVAHGDEESAQSLARREFQLGLEAAQAGNLARAAEHFQSAQNLSPNPVVLYNLGQVYSALGKPVEAERALQSYLTAEPAPTPERAREVEQLIAYNAGRIGLLVLEVTPSDATIEIDGVPRTGSATGIRLAAGRHVLVATKAGHRSAILNVDIRAEQEFRAQIELTPDAAPVRPAPERPPQASLPPTKRLNGPARPVPSHGSALVRPFALSAAGLGLFTIGLGSVLGLQARSLNGESKADGHCDASGCDDVGSRLRFAALHKGDLATGLFVAGGALLAAGATFYVVLANAAGEGTPVSVSARSFGTRAADLSVGVGFE